MNWTVQEATAEQREELLRLEGDLFGPESALRAEWLFEANPEGKALVLVAVNRSGRILGTRALLPWRLRADGAEVVVGQYARTWTHPDFRNRGISVALGGELNRRSAELGYPLVVLFPSVRSIPGHRRLGNRVDPLLERRQMVTSVRFFVPRSPAFLETPLRWGRRLVGWRARPRPEAWAPEPEAPRRADELAARWNPGGVTGVRDGRFVGWRFHPDSGRDYRAWRYPAEGKVRMLAFTHFAGHRGRIVDLWGDCDVPESADALAGLIRRLVEGGVWLVEWCPPRNGEGPAVASRAGLLPRREGVPLARWFNRPERDLGSLADIGRYRLTEGDSDYA